MIGFISVWLDTLRGHPCLWPVIMCLPGRKCLIWLLERQNVPWGVKKSKVIYLKRIGVIWLLYTLRLWQPHDRENSEDCLLASTSWRTVRREARYKPKHVLPVSHLPLLMASSISLRLTNLILSPSFSAWQTPPLPPLPFQSQTVVVFVFSLSDSGGSIRVQTRFVSRSRVFTRFDQGPCRESSLHNRWCGRFRHHHKAEQWLVHWNRQLHGNYSQGKEWIVLLFFF